MSNHPWQYKTVNSIDAMNTLASNTPTDITREGFKILHWVPPPMCLPSLASQPTSAQRKGSGQLSIRMLSHQNVISYATFGLHLCDSGIISRCSAALQQSGYANSETSTICSSRLPGPS